MLSGELKTPDQFRQLWKDNPVKLERTATNPYRRIFWKTKTEWNDRF